jgi:hypothetical protein
MDEDFIDEDFIDEVNDALSVLWKAGRKIRSVELLESLKKAADLAIHMGWSSESDDGIDYDSAYFIFQSNATAHLPPASGGKVPPVVRASGGSDET